MGDGQPGAAGRHGGDQLEEAGHHALPDRLGALPAGDDVEVALVEAGELLGVLRGVLLVGEPLALPEVELPQPRVVRRSPAARGQDRLRGLPGAQQVRAPDDVGLEGGHGRRDGRGLLVADVVEGNVELPLDAAGVVVRGPPVPQQHEPAAVGLGAAHGRVTSSGSVMAGQSRHRRSRA